MFHSQVVVSMVPSLNKSDEADNWVYLGEGNLNLVKGKVLRVIKNCKNEKLSAQDSILFKKQFSEKVIQPLLGKEYVVPMFPVHTSVDFLQKLAFNVEPHRPAFRTDRQIVVNSPTSFLLDDLTQIWPNSTAMTFELKPKWGFKPDSSSIDMSNTIKKRTTCRFCMHSYLRRVPQNNFCPLDLYSIDQVRVRKAVNVLLKENPLKKTLSVSINGKKASLTSEIDQQLFSTFIEYNDDHNTLMQDILERVLLHDPILKILKSLQMNLDEIDVEGIYSLFQRNKDYFKLVMDDINVWMDVVNRYQQRLEMENSSINELDEQKQRIYEYILSMTFKDCSLMINVTPTVEGNNTSKIITLPNGLSFQYDIKVIDTDLKSIDKIPFWFELDQSIVRHAIETKFDKECHQ
ncbi:inositol-pentakisphosphate 2-kinase [Helicostylum pulchrum]|nr:inositol-pentakisphosphate 2-kinase [Helicostylum pulchrum]